MASTGLKIILASTTLAVIAIGFVYSASLMNSQGSGETLSSSTSSSTTVPSSGTATSSLIRTSPGIGSQSSTGRMLKLSFDKASYAEGGVPASVTVVLENNGTQSVTVDDPGVAPQLVVYDSGMNQVGSWTRFQKAQEMNPPAGPVVLAGGEKYSWTLQWDLAVTPAAGARQVGLSPGQYLVEATLQVGVGVPASYGPLTSEVVPVTVS